jgi:SAM-dependent methyltransferase
MTAARGLADFYDVSYRRSGEHGGQFARWRDFCAGAKADHVQQLCSRAGLRPRHVVEVGCGDGALLAELSGRSFAPAFTGFDIAESGIESTHARQIAGLARAEVFDGRRVPADDAAFDLGILSHVIEHVPEPLPVLTEVARVGRAVIVEVPLEQNISARRSAKRGQASAIGHVNFFDRHAMIALVEQTGLRVAAELSDPLTLAHHSFFAATSRQHTIASLKAAVRRSIFVSSSRLAELLFTVHYACLCVPSGRVSSASERERS